MPISTKGERRLAALQPQELPRSEAPLPEAFKQEAVLRYDLACFDLATPVAELLGCSLEEGCVDAAEVATGIAAPTVVPTEAMAARASRALERYLPGPGEDVFYSSSARKRLVERVRASKSLCATYERLMHEAVGPMLAKELLSLEASGCQQPVSSGDGSIEFVYPACSMCILPAGAQRCGVRAPAWRGQFLVAFD